MAHGIGKTGLWWCMVSQRMRAGASTHARAQNQFNADAHGHDFVVMGRRREVDELRTATPSTAQRELHGWVRAGAGRRQECVVPMQGYTMVQ